MIIRAAVEARSAAAATKPTATIRAIPLTRAWPSTCSSVRYFASVAIQPQSPPEEQDPSHSLVTPAQESRPLFEVKQTHGKGLGVFATTAIPYASRILEEPVILEYKLGEDLLAVYDRFLSLPVSDQEKILSLHASGRLRRRVNVFALLRMALRGEGKDSLARLMQFTDIDNINAIQLEKQDPKEPMAGLFSTCARFNHSCVPNADHCFDWDSRQKIVLANRDIDPGEEITISYVNPADMHLMRHLRLKNWYIECECDGCQPKHPEYERREERIRRLVELHEDPSMDAAGRLRSRVKDSIDVLQEAAAMARERVKLLEEHHCWRRYAAHAYLGAFDVAMALYKLSGERSILTDAVRMSDRIIELDGIFRGSSAAVSKQYREIRHGLRQEYGV